jgi:flagellar biosynthesis protein FliP
MISLTLVGGPHVLSLVPVMAQVDDLRDLIGGSDPTVNGRIVQIIGLLTVLSLAPGLLVMMTSFTRFIIALSFLRSGLGLQTTPANSILVSLALFMTFFVMSPVFDKSWENGVRPLIEHNISEEAAVEKILEPFRDFMLSNVRDKELKLFEDLATRSTAGKTAVTSATGKPSVDIRQLIPAFMVSELRRGFEIGFLVTLPFLIIDIIVSTLVMSMGMMMFPPTVLSLPFKVLFFVLIDGWSMLVGSLVRSFNVS